MSVSNVPSEHARANWKLPDPGDAGALPNTKSGSVALVSAAAETRTLARPSKVDLQLLLYLNTDGGDITLTITGGYDVGGSTSIVMGTVGGYVMLRAVEEGTTKRWQIMGYDGVTGPSLDFATLTVDTLNIDTLLDLQGVADALVLDADGDTGFSAPTDDIIDVECGGTDMFNFYATGSQDHGVEAVTATVGGGTTGLISQGSKNVTATSDTATKQISLPAAEIGDVIKIHVLGAACELISAVAAHTVNDVTVGATNELALVEDSHYTCEYVETNGWIVTGKTKLGADEAALVPDAL